MVAILADDTNLGLARMAESSRGLTHVRLLWTSEWHIRDETYAGALAAIVDHHHAHLFSRTRMASGSTCSSTWQRPQRDRIRARLAIMLSSVRVQPGQKVMTRPGSDGPVIDPWWRSWPRRNW